MLAGGHLIAKFVYPHNIADARLAANAPADIAYLLDELHKDGAWNEAIEAAAKKLASLANSRRGNALHCDGLADTYPRRRAHWKDQAALARTIATALEDAATEVLALKHPTQEQEAGK